MKIKNILRIPYILTGSLIATAVGFVFELVAATNRYIDGVDINEEVKKFPIYSASSEEFSCLKDNVIQAIDTYKRDGQATLGISIDEINAVNARVHRGSFLSRNPTFFRPPLFYVIEKDRILQQIMSVPGLYRFGYLHVTIAITYIVKDGDIFEHQQLLESYGKSVDANDSPKIDIVPLEQSKLITSILKPIFEYSEIMPLINSIEHICIQEDLLQIEFASSSDS
jgi:hypothetical protein